MKSERWKYDAFISYHHSELDTYIAELIHDGLERLRIPPAIQKQCEKKKFQRIFRDKDEMQASDDLNDDIKEALTESEYLIVICSSKSAKAHWVLREINFFLETHSHECVLTVFGADGSLDYVPESLLKKEKTMISEDGGNQVRDDVVEPMAADFRGKTRKEIRKKCKTELLRLAASMLGCSYPDLRQRDREYKMRRLFALLSGCLVFAIGFGAFAVWQYRRIQENYYQLQVNRARYLAKTSLELLESGDRIRAIQVAMEALPDEENPDRPAITEAEYALNRALYSYQFDSNLKSSRVLEPERDFDSGNLFFSPDGKNLLILDNNKDLSIWSLDTLLCIWEMNEADSDGATGDCVYADFLSDDEIIAVFSGSMNYIVRINFVTGEKIYRVDLPDIYFTTSDCQLSPGGRWFAINSGEKVALAQVSDGTLSELEYADKYPNMELGPHAMGLAFSQDEEKMVVFFSDESTSFHKPYDVYVWNIENEECMGLTTENGSTYSSCFLSNGDIVVLSKNYDIQESFGGMFGTYSISCYSGKDLQLLWNYDGIGTLSKRGEYKVESQKISIDNQKMEGVICTVANQLLVLREDTGEMIDTKSFSGNIIGVYPVYLSDMESCDRLTVGVEDGTIYLITFSKGSMYLLLSITAEDGEREGDNGKFIWNDVEKMGIMSTGHDKKIYLSEEISDPDYIVLNTGKYFAINSGLITFGGEQVYAYNVIYTSSDPDEFQLYITDVNTRDVLLEEKGSWFCELLPVECADQFYLITHWSDLNDNSLIRVHDMTTFETLCEIGADQAHILEGFHNDDLVSFHHKLEILDLSETNEIWKINLETGTESMVLDKTSLKKCGIDGVISNAYISNDDRYLVVETFGIIPEEVEGFFVMDLDSGQMVADQWFRMCSRGDLALSDDGSLIAYYAPGNGIVVADISTMETLQEIPFKSSSKANFWFIKNDRYLLIESDTGYLYSWDLNNQCKVAEDSIRVSSNGKCYSSDDIFVIEEYNFESLNNIGYFTDFTEHVYCVEDDGSFSRYLDLPNSFYCGDYVMAINGNRSVVYRLRTLEESLAYAKEVTEGRELSEMDKIKYFIE